MSRNSGIPRQTNVSVLPGLHQVDLQDIISIVILGYIIYIRITTYDTMICITIAQRILESMNNNYSPLKRTIHVQNFQ